MPVRSIEVCAVIIHWGSIADFYDVLLQGAWLTIVISVSAFALAVAIGIVVAGARLSSLRAIRWLATVYVEFLRNTPALLQIFIIYYGLPSFGIRFSATTAGILGLGLNVGAYLGEIFRAGVSAVPRGHKEAAVALALTPLQTLIWVTTPVALRAVYPAIGNMFIATVLGSSLLSAIAVPELTGQTNDVSSRTFLTIEVYSASAVIYIALTVGFSLIFGLVGRHFLPRASRI
jgi:polar amino acid transport system permease protein